MVDSSHSDDKNELVTGYVPCETMPFDPFIAQQEYNHQSTSGVRMLRYLAYQGRAPSTDFGKWYSLDK